MRPVIPALARPSRQRETLVLPERRLSVLKAGCPMPPSLRQSIYLRPYCLTEDGLTLLSLRERFSPGAVERSDCTDIRRRNRRTADQALLPIYECRPVKPSGGRPKKELWIATKRGARAQRRCKDREWC